MTDTPPTEGPPAPPTETAPPAAPEEIEGPADFQPGMHIGTSQFTVACGPTEDGGHVVLHIEHGFGSTVVILDKDTARSVAENLSDLAGPPAKKLEVVHRPGLELPPGMTRRPRPGQAPG